MQYSLNERWSYNKLPTVVRARFVVPSSKWSRHTTAYLVGFHTLPAQSCTPRLIAIIHVFTRFWSRHGNKWPPRLVHRGTQHSDGITKAVWWLPVLRYFVSKTLRTFTPSTGPRCCVNNALLRDAPRLWLSCSWRHLPNVSQRRVPHSETQSNSSGFEERCGQREPENKTSRCCWSC